MVFSPHCGLRLSKHAARNVPLLASIGFTLAPLMDGLFMFIMKDPERAREMGLLSVKAQLVMSDANWTTFFSVLTQAISVGGVIVFSIVTAWVFGREFSDHTAKDLMALPTPRENIVTAKFVVISAWGFVTVLWIYLIGLVLGDLVDIPGWTSGLALQSIQDVLVTAGMTLLLMTPVAFIASMGTRLPSTTRLGCADDLFLTDYRCNRLGRLVPVVCTRPL